MAKFNLLKVRGKAKRSKILGIGLGNFGKWITKEMNKYVLNLVRIVGMRVLFRMY